jgi:hypothetical protein
LTQTLVCSNIEIERGGKNMKKYFGYGLIVIIGVVGIISMMFRSESIDNNILKSSNTVELFA